MDNTTTQPSHLRPLGDIIPVELIPNNSVRQNVQDKLTQASALDNLNKKIREFNANKDDFSLYAENRTKKLNAREKALNEKETYTNKQQSVIDADKKRLNEQSKQVLQDKAKNDEKEKELTSLANDLGEKGHEIDHLLASTKDDHLVAQSLLGKAETILNQSLELQTNSFQKNNEQFTILFQKLADNDARTDLILEELNKLQEPQVKKQANTQLDLPKIDVSVKSSIKNTILSKSYKFTDLNGNDLGKCKDENLIDNLYDLDHVNDLELNTLLFIFEDNTEVEFNALSVENQQHFIDYQKSS